MKVAFFASDKPRERILADAVLRGAKKHGLTTELVPLGKELGPGHYDVICTFGVKSNLRWKSHRAEGSTLVMFDKGYSRDGRTGAKKKWEYFRIAVNDHQPTQFLMEKDFPSDRWEALDIDIKPWRTRGDHIVIAGSTAKYHTFYDLPYPTDYWKEMLTHLIGRTDRDIVYRPKPSWGEAEPIQGTIYSRKGTIETVLEDAWALITHGSNACFEAMINGIPSIVLGNAVAKPISSRTLDKIEEPTMAKDPARLKLLSALAYHQWTCSEFIKGQPWEVMLEEIFASA